MVDTDTVRPRPRPQTPADGGGAVTRQVHALTRPRPRPGPEVNVVQVCQAQLAPLCSLKNPSLRSEPATGRSAALIAEYIALYERARREFPSAPRLFDLLDVERAKAKKGGHRRSHLPLQGGRRPLHPGLRAGPAPRRQVSLERSCPSSPACRNRSSTSQLARSTSTASPTANEREVAVPQHAELVPAWPPLLANTPVGSRWSTPTDERPGRRRVGTCSAATGTKLWNKQRPTEWRSSDPICEPGGPLSATTSRRGEFSP